MFIVSRPIKCKMKLQKITVKPQHWLVTTWREKMSWLFLLPEIFNFTIFKYWNFSFSISALVSPKNDTIDMIDMNDILWKSDIKSRRQDQSIRHRQRVWEREKMSQSQAMLLCVCFTCSSKGPSLLWLVVFDPYCFVLVAEKPLPMMWTCTVVNFHNLHSLLGQFGSLVFEQTESSD